MIASFDLKHYQLYSDPIHLFSLSDVSISLGSAIV